jgi:hypothetical protein
MANDLTELVYSELKQELNRLKAEVQINSQVERALVSDSIPAYTLATAPLAAQGGLGNGSSYISLAWISNGRRPGEGAGLGTGVLAFYDTLSNTWIRIDTYTAVTV